MGLAIIVCFGQGNYLISKVGVESVPLVENSWIGLLA